MNKLKQMTKLLMVEGGVLLAVMAAALIVFWLTGNLATGAAERKAQAESALSQDNMQLGTVRTQLDRSGEATKRYVEIELQRTAMDFTSSTDALKDWMREAKADFRLANNFKLNLPPEKPTDKGELSGLEYNITYRESVAIELEAMSDLHVYSFVDALMRDAPGLMRPTYLEVERRNDLSSGIISQMMGGLAPNLVIGRVRFDWVGINPKQTTPGQQPPAAQPGVVP